MKMNENWNSLTGTTSYSVVETCKASCRKIVERLAAMKESIVHEFRHSFGVDEHLLRLALNEAEALAWQTGVPQLVFADLAAEKAQTLLNWQAHQQQMLPAASQAAYAV